tara:strand:- start:1980 stop:2531 length:552 start_codon:yes stop_codon:yes gene_type:complete
MIHSALSFLELQVNQYLNRDLNSDSNILEIGFLKDSAGSPSFNKLGMTMVAIDRETTIPYGLDIKEINTSQVIRQKRPLCLNIKILVSSNFQGNYEDALKYLGEVIAFFHTNNVFTHENSPTLDKNIQKLIVEINPNDTDDMYHFWSMAGISYLPSIIYRVRMVSFGSLASEALPAMTGMQSV